jgi:hypothetical protein
VSGGAPRPRLWRRVALDRPAHLARSKRSGGLGQLS